MQTKHKDSRMQVTDKYTKMNGEVQMHIEGAELLVSIDTESKTSLGKLSYLTNGLLKSLEPADVRFSRL